MKNKSISQFLMPLLLNLALIHFCFGAEELTKPISSRELALIITEMGHFPQKLTAFEGEEVRFFVTSHTKDPGCMMIERHDLFLAAPRGKVAEASVKLEFVGEFKIYCPSHDSFATLTVLPHPQSLSKSSSNISRGIASDIDFEDHYNRQENRPKYWMPRDE
jgi:hypothetical protein